MRGFIVINWPPWSCAWVSHAFLGTSFLGGATAFAFVLVPTSGKTCHLYFSGDDEKGCWVWGVIFLCLEDLGVFRSPSGGARPGSLLQGTCTFPSHQHPTNLCASLQRAGEEDLPKVNVCLPQGLILITQISGVKLILLLGSWEQWVSLEPCLAHLWLISGVGMRPAACEGPVEMPR